MDKVIMVFVIIIVLIAFGFIVYNFSTISDPKPADKSGKSLLDFLGRKGATMASNAPVFYYRIPGEEPKKVQLMHTRTTIGSGDSCDIVIKHPSVSDLHAEIYLAVKKDRRFFVIKNHSKTNPIEFLDPEMAKRQEAHPYRYIVKTLPLVHSISKMYMGDVAVQIKNQYGHRETETFRTSGSEAVSGKTKHFQSGKNPKNTNEESAGTTAGNSEEDELLDSIYNAGMRRSRKSSRLL